MKKTKLIICIVGLLLFQLKSYTQVYDILIKNAKEKKGVGNVQDLLNAGDTWKVN